MNLTGTWRGHYSYDENPDLPKLHSRPIPFEMSLKQRWFGIVTGSLQEDARNGFAEPGKIRGSFKAPIFRFGKHMPKLRIVHEGQNQSLVDWAERWKFVLDDPDEPHPTIHCLGTLSDDGATLSGTWRMAETKITIPGRGGPLLLPELSGTWSAQRAPVTGLEHTMIRTAWLAIVLILTCSIAAYAATAVTDAENHFHLKVPDMWEVLPRDSWPESPVKLPGGGDAVDHRQLLLVPRGSKSFQSPYVIVEANDRPPSGAWPAAFAAALKRNSERRIKSLADSSPVRWELTRNLTAYDEASQSIVHEIEIRKDGTVARRGKSVYLMGKTELVTIFLGDSVQGEVDASGPFDELIASFTFERGFTQPPPSKDDMPWIFSVGLITAVALALGFAIAWIRKLLRRWEG